MANISCRSSKPHTAPNNLKYSQLIMGKDKHGSSHNCPEKQIHENRGNN